MKNGSVCRRFVRNTSVLIISLALMVSASVQAGNHWLSRVTVEQQMRSETVMLSSQIASEKELATAMATSSKVVFDITISLDANPQGDDDSTADNGANDTEQRAYEERIKEFANAVYQSTNGVHKIGKVTIFRKGAFANLADVKWNEDCVDNEGPRANTSGFGVAGKRIWMCTNWPGASTLMSTPKGGGYTLAHEWGHYAYGLYDEYASEQCDKADIAAGTCHEGTPRGTDTQAIPAIMNNQWKAARGDADYLEHSTQNIDPHRSDSTGTDAQKRVFGESAWETLTRDSESDPKFHWLPERTQYGALTAPTDPMWIVNNDESPAQSMLDIRWVGDQVTDLLIDRSGSMAGTPLANAKTGSNLLIDQLQAGTALGVSSFETNVSRNFAITNIPDPDTGVRAAAKTALNAITVANMTSMYDGLIFSLNDVKSFDMNRPGLVYVLSDGMDNDSIATEASVISAYQAAGVPIISFAYGSFAPTGTLLNISNATGGAFYQSPTTLAEIQAVLLAAQAQFSSNVLLSSIKIAVPSGVTYVTIPLDSTLASVRLNLSHGGNQSDLDFKLLLLDGTDSGVQFVCEGSSSCSTTLDSAFFATYGYGDYQIEIRNNIGTNKDVTVLVSATPLGTETYDIAVSFSSNTVNYPSAMAIRATVTNEPAITGLDVTAKVTGPMGIIFDLTLLDDGNGADQAADDGTYSASIPYVDNGIYSTIVTASNAAGNGKTTFEGINISLREDGTAYTPSPTSIVENFVRVGSASASVVGVLVDDHANNPTSGACTVIIDNNFDTAGRIDFAGDTDCFSFLPSSLSNPVVVRTTSLTSGMDPLLTVFDSSGTHQIAQVDMSTTQSPEAGVTVTIPASNVDPYGLVFAVRHIDTTAIEGGYTVSAGVALTSDKGTRLNCDIDKNRKFDLLDVKAWQNGCTAGTAMWLCDINKDNLFNYRDVTAYQTRCKRFPVRDIWTTSVYGYDGDHHLSGCGGGKNDDALRVGGWGDEYYSLLLFDLSNLKRPVKKATLRLYNTDAGTGSSTATRMHLDRITSNWNWKTQPLGACAFDNKRLWWVNRPRYVPYLSSLPKPKRPGYWQVDVTDFVEGVRTGLYRNYGLQLRPVSTWNNFNNFASSENPTIDWRPQLILKY